MSHSLDGTVPAQRCACTHFAKADEVTECRFCDCKDHRPARSPYQGNDPGTPVGAEVALQEFSDSLDAARVALEKARNEEVAAKHARDAARRRATLSEECPRVARDAFTVAYRDAWVDEQIVAEELDYDLARTARQAANEHLRTLREQGIIQQSITKSVSQSYGMSTGSGRW